MIQENTYHASLNESSHCHLSSQREAQVQSTVMRTAAQTADPTSLSSPSSSLHSSSVSRGRSDQAHQGGTKLSFDLAVTLHLPQEGPGFGEGGYWIPHEASWGSLDG